MNELEQQIERHRVSFDGNEEAAVFKAFETIISQRGLVSNPEFILPPNDFGIVAGDLSIGGEQPALVSAIPGAVGARVSLNALKARGAQARAFVEAVAEGRAVDDLDDNLQSLFRSFRRGLASNPALPSLTRVLLVTPGLVKDVDRTTLRECELKLDVLDFEDHQGTRASGTVDIDFEQLGSPPEVVQATSVENDHDVYMGYITGETLAKMFDQYGNDLLEGNVREFLGTVGPNKGIAQTLKECPERFSAYNNGITIVAQEAQVEDGQVKLGLGLTVVNGGQTTVSIFNAMTNGLDLAEVSVPMKLVVVQSSTEPARKTLIGAISLFSNTQSKVSTADRMVNEKPHEELQQLSEKEELFSGGKGWFYERKRGQSKTKKLTLSEEDFKAWRAKFPEECMMSAGEICIAWNAWMKQPEVGARGKNRGFEQYHSQLQMKLASTSWSPELHHKRTVGLVMLYKHIRLHMEREFSGLASATVPHVLGWLVHLTSNRLDLVSFWRNGKLPASVTEAVSDLAPIVDHQIRTREQVDHKEWAKKPECTRFIWALEPPSNVNINSLPLAPEAHDIGEDPVRFVTDIGIDRLWKMYFWGKEQQLFYYTRILTDILRKTLGRGRDPSVNQAWILARAWVTCMTYGFDPEALDEDSQ